MCHIIAGGRTFYLRDAKPQRRAEPRPQRRQRGGRGGRGVLLRGAGRRRLVARRVTAAALLRRRVEVVDHAIDLAEPPLARRDEQPCERAVARRRERGEALVACEHRLGELAAVGRAVQHVERERARRVGRFRGRRRRRAARGASCRLVARVRRAPRRASRRRARRHRRRAGCRVPQSHGRGECDASRAQQYSRSPQPQPSGHGTGEVLLM